MLCMYVEFMKAHIFLLSINLIIPVLILLQDSSICFSFAGSLVRWFIGSFVGSLVRWFVGSFVLLLVSLFISIVA